jgi:protein-S-isoprenylcysteine O-methyltransferase Ste14
MRHVIETTIATIVVPGLFMVLVPWLILSATGDHWPERLGPIEWLALAGMAVGLAMVVSVSWTFVTRGRGTPIPLDPPREFVAVGPFRHMRNPMYSGGLLILLAEALLFRSGWLLAYAAALWAIFHTVLLIYEEPQLEQRFGQTYRAYKKTVPRWIPRLRV